MKGEDDGSIFATFLKESRLPADSKSYTWENVREIMDAYKVLQFFKWKILITLLTIASIVYSVLQQGKHLYA